MAGARHRRFAMMDCAVVKRFVIPAPVQLPQRASANGKSRRNKRLGTGGWFPVLHPAVNKHTSAKAA